MITVSVIKLLTYVKKHTHEWQVPNIAVYQEEFWDSFPHCSPRAFAGKFFDYVETYSFICVFCLLNMQIKHVLAYLTVNIVGLSVH